MTLSTRTMSRFVCGEWGAVRTSSGELEVDLFLEGVDFRDLDFDFVAEANDAPTAAANQMVPRGIEDVKIVNQRRKRHEAGHAEARHIDEETKVVDVSHERRIAFRPPGLDLGPQKREELHIFAVAFGIGGVPF